MEGFNEITPIHGGGGRREEEEGRSIEQALSCASSFWFPIDSILFWAYWDLYMRPGRRRTFGGIGIMCLRLFFLFLKTP